MAGNSGTSSTRSGKSELRFVKGEFPVLLVKEEEETMTAGEHNSLKEKCEFLSENLELERSGKMGLEKEMKELEDRFLRLKRETMLLREEKMREKIQREEYEKVLEEMKTKERESIKTMGEMREEIRELSMAKGRAEVQVEMWRSRLSELEKMVMEVAKDCLEVRSLYLNEMNRGVCSVRTGETRSILGKNSNPSMKKDADVIDISDSEEDKNNLHGDGLEMGLERNREDGKRLRIWPDLNRDSDSSCKSGGGRRVSSVGFTPRPLSPSSSSTDTSSSDSESWALGLV